MVKFCWNAIFSWRSYFVKPHNTHIIKLDIPCYKNLSPTPTQALGRSWWVSNYHKNVSKRLVSKKVMFITRKISSLAGFSLGTASGPLLWSPHSLLWRWCSTGHHFYFLLLFLCYCLLVCFRFVFHSPPVVVTGLYRWSFLLNSCLYVIACLCIVLSFIRLLLWRRCSPGDPFDLTLAFMLLFVLFFIRLLIWWWCSAGDLD